MRKNVNGEFLAKPFVTPPIGPWCQRGQPRSRISVASLQLLERCRLRAVVHAGTPSLFLHCTQPNKYSYFIFASSSFPPGSKYPFPYSPMTHPQTFPLLNYFILSCLILVYLGWNPNLTEVSGKTPIDSNRARISSFVLIRLWVCLPWIYLILSWFDCSFWIGAMLHLCALTSV